MPRSASQWLHEILGSPAVEGCGPVEDVPSCWLCAGDVYRGRDREQWAASSMTDQNQARCPGSPVVCEACAYVRFRSSPVPGRVAGKCSRCGGSGLESAASKLVKHIDGVRVGDVCAKCAGSGMNAMGGNFRNYSHVVELVPGEAPFYANWSKGEKPAILAFLRREKRGPWFAGIADSGQKHIVMYAPINPTGGLGGAVMFDEVWVDLPTNRQGWTIVDDMVTLLTAGASKEGVETGRYTDGAWGRCADLIRTFERAYGHLRGGAWFTLAVWLAQADQAAIEERLAREKAERAAKKTARKPRKEKHVIG